MNPDEIAAQWDAWFADAEQEARRRGLLPVAPRAEDLATVDLSPTLSLEELSARPRLDPNAPERRIEGMNRRVSPMETLGVMARDVPSAIAGAPGAVARFLGDVGRGVADYRPYGDASATFVDRSRAEVADEALWDPSNPNLITVTAQKPQRSLIERAPVAAMNAADMLAPVADVGGVILNEATVGPGQRLVDRYAGIEAALERGDDAYAEELAQGGTADALLHGVNALGVGALTQIGRGGARAAPAAAEEILAPVAIGDDVSRPIADQLLDLPPYKPGEDPKLTRWRDMLTEERNAEIAAENAAKAGQRTAGFGHADTLAARAALDAATARNGGAVAPRYGENALPQPVPVVPRPMPRYGDNGLPAPAPVVPPARIDPVNQMRFRASDPPDRGAIFPQAGPPSPEILAPVGNALDGAPGATIGVSASNDVGPIGRVREALTPEPRNLPRNPLAGGAIRPDHWANDRPFTPDVIRGGGATTPPRPPASLDVVSPASTPYDGIAFPPGAAQNAEDRLAYVRNIVEEAGEDEAIAFFEAMNRTRAADDPFTLVTNADIEAVRSGAYLRPASTVDTVRPRNMPPVPGDDGIYAPVPLGLEGQGGRQSVRNSRQGVESANASATSAEPRRTGRPPHPRQAEILDLAQTMSVREIAAQTGVSEKTIRPILERNGVRMGGPGRPAKADRNARILALLEERQPNGPNPAGAGRVSDTSYTALAAQLRAEGFDDVTENVIKGVVNRQGRPGAKAESVEDAAAALGISPERYRALSARAPQTDLLGPVMIGGAGGAMLLDAGSAEAQETYDDIGQNGRDLARIAGLRPSGVVTADGAPLYALPDDIDFTEMLPSGAPGDRVQLSDGRYARTQSRIDPTTDRMLRIYYGEDGALLGVRVVGQHTDDAVDVAPEPAAPHAFPNDFSPVGDDMTAPVEIGAAAPSGPNGFVTGGAALIASILSRGRGGEALRGLERGRIAQGGRAFSRPVRIGADMVSATAGGAGGGAAAQALQGGDWADGAALGALIGGGYGAGREAVTREAQRWDDVMRFADDLERTPPRQVRTESARLDPWDNRTVEAVSADGRSYYVPEITVKTPDGPVVIVEPEGRAALAEIGPQLRERFEYGVTPNGRRAPRDLEGREALMDEIVAPVILPRDARAAEIANWSATPSENARRALASDPVGRPRSTAIVNPGAGTVEERAARLAADRDAGLGIFSPAAISRRESADAEAAVRAAANNDVAAIARRQRELAGVPVDAPPAAIAGPISDDLLAPVEMNAVEDAALRTQALDAQGVPPVRGRKGIEERTLGGRATQLTGKTAGAQRFSDADLQAVAEAAGVEIVAGKGGRLNRSQTARRIAQAIEERPRLGGVLREKFGDLPLAILVGLGAGGAAAVSDDDYAPVRLAM